MVSAVKLGIYVTNEDGYGMRSDGKVVMDSRIDTDATDLDRCAESNSSQRPFMKNIKYRLLA